MNITVIGSINMDIVTTVEKHPVTGETVTGWGTVYLPGGKGANQAVATYLAGGNVSMVGAIGNDIFANDLIENLENIGLNTKYILHKNTNSGLAFITVNSQGDNNIILSQGANGELAIKDIKQMEAVFNKTDILLLQNEIPWETTEFSIEEAHRKGVKVVFNPAPASNVNKESFSKVDILVLNESEASVFTNMKVENVSQAKKAMCKLLELGIKEVIVTLGVNGSLYANEDGTTIYTPSFKVPVLDTTAAGDTFIGAFVSTISKNLSIKNSLEFATAAAALAVTKKGAQTSIPNRDAINKFLESKNETYSNVN